MVQYFTPCRRPRSLMHNEIPTQTTSEIPTQITSEIPTETPTEIQDGSDATD